MADEIAKLVVSVDSTSAQQASKDLDRLAESGGRASSSVGGNFSKVIQASYASLGRWSDGLEKVRAHSAAASGGAAQDFNQASQAISMASEKSLSSWNRGLTRLRADSARTAEAVIADQQRIAARTAQIAKAVADYRTSQTATSVGGGVSQAAGHDVQHFVDLNNRLEDYRDRAIYAHLAQQKLAQGQGALAEGAKKVAKETGTATKAVHQFSFTSGQAAREYAVLVNELQRGDFTRFQGSLITLGNRVGLMPMLFTAAGAAIASVAAVMLTFAAAAAAGAAESEKFNKQMALTAEFAHTSQGEIVEWSRKMSDSAITTGEMREAMLAVAGSGRFFRDEIQAVGRSVAEMSRLTGKSADDMVKEFIKLREDPLRAVTELNKTMHFLDEGTRDAIRSAQEHGDMERAAALAMEAVERASSKATVSMVEDAGYIVTAWRAVVGMVSQAKDAMLDIGRTSSREEQLATAKTKMLSALSDFRTAQAGRGFAERGLGGPNLDDAGKKLVETTNAWKALNKEVGDVHALRDRQAAESRVKQEQMEATQRLHDSSLQFDRAARRTQELAAAQHDYVKALQGAPNDQKKQNELLKQYEGIVAGINHRWRDFKTGSSSMTDAQRAAAKEATAHAQELKSLDTQIEQHRATVEEAGLAQDKLSETERWAVQTIAKMSMEYSHLTEAEKKEAQQRIENIVDVDRHNRALESHNKLIEMNARALEDLDRAGRTRKTEAEREIRDVGMGGDASELQHRLDQINDRYTSQRIRLTEEYRALNKETSKEYLEGIEQINQAEKAQVEAERQYYAQRKAAMLDWQNGARSAMQNFIEDAQNLAGHTAEAFSGLFDGIADNLTKFITGATTDFKGMVDSFIADLIRMSIRFEMSKLFQNFFGGFLGGGSLFGGGGGGSDFGIPLPGSGALSGFGSSMGNVFSNQNVVQHSMGDVITRMAAFRMGDGRIGTMSEHDPEAIMPLSRGSDGKLGVKMTGAAASSPTVVNHHYNVSVNVSPETNKVTADHVADKTVRKIRHSQRNRL